MGLNLKMLLIETWLLIGHLVWRGMLDAAQIVKMLNIPKVHVRRILFRRIRTIFLSNYDFSTLSIMGDQIYNYV